MYEFVQQKEVGILKFISTGEIGFSEFGLSDYSADQNVDKSVKF